MSQSSPKIDLSFLLDMDPSQQNGHRLVFEKTLNIELKLDTQVQEGAVESILLRVLVEGDPSRPSLVKLEMLSENDLFFNFCSSLDPEVFQEIKEQQQLHIEYSNLTASLIKIVESCVNTPQTFFPVFFMRDDGSAHLNFVENLDYKFAELISLPFLISSEENVKLSISLLRTTLSDALQSPVMDCLSQKCTMASCTTSRRRSYVCPGIVIFVVCSTD